jgi:hypothetical protein
MISWFAADAVGINSAKDRRIIALSGLAPDIDVLAYLGGIVYFGFDKDLAFEHVWQVVHHRYTHGLGFILLTGIVSFIIVSRGSMRKDVVFHASGIAILSMIASMVHVFCDIVAGGPTWAVFPLWPFSDFGWAVNWSWVLADWTNTAILFSCLAGMMFYAKTTGRSPLESINYDLEKWFVTIVQHGSSISPDEQSNTARIKKTMWIRIFVYLFLILLIIAVLFPLGFSLDQLNLPF